MGSASIPDRIPATTNDLATNVMRSLGQHMEIGVRLTFDARLDADVLARAVRLSLDAEPVLGCGLVTTFARGWWQRREDLDDHVPFAAVETDDADLVAARYQTAPVPDSGPQVEVTLLRAPDHDDLVVSMSHDVADGQSVKQYAYLLADVYSRLLEDPAYAVEPDLARRPEAKDAWGALSEPQRRAASKEPRPTMPNWRLASLASTGRGRTLRELRLSPARLAALKDHGRARGATVNDVLLTAFFRALLRTHPQPGAGPLSLAFSAEHRRFLDEEEPPLSNLAVTIWLGIEGHEGEGFDDTLARVTEQTKRWRESMWGLRSAVRMTGLSKMGYAPMKMLLGAIMKSGGDQGRTSPIFTNIGILDEERLSFAGTVPVDARMSGPAAFGASFVPTISTYRDTLTISMGFCESDLDPSAVGDVLASMDEELAALD